MKYSSPRASNLDLWGFLSATAKQPNVLKWLTLGRLPYHISYRVLLSKLRVGQRFRTYTEVHIASAHKSTETPAWIIIDCAISTNVGSSVPPRRFVPVCMVPSTDVIFHTPLNNYQILYLCTHPHYHCEWFLFYFQSDVQLVP